MYYRAETWEVYFWDGDIWTIYGGLEPTEFLFGGKTGSTPWERWFIFNFGPLHLVFLKNTEPTEEANDA